MRPLLLAGPPAAGKSTTGRQLAASTRRGAFIDVDDVRHLVVGGHAAPWDGEAGRQQQHLGVENACDLARRFASHRMDVVLADVLSPETTAIYRARISDLVIIGLRISPDAAQRRAAGRPHHLTRTEFDRLHADERRYALAYDHVVEVDDCDGPGQIELVRRLWS